MDQIEVDFFLVNVSNGQPKNENFDIMNNIEFPVENRPTKPQKSDDGVGYFNLNKTLSRMVKFSNFHLLLYLARRMDIELVKEVARCIRDGRDVPESLEAKITNAVANRK